MKKRKIIGILMILFTFFWVTILGQTPIDDDISDPEPVETNELMFPVPLPKNGTTRDIIPPSPKVASLGIFGQVPVGHFTGTATIDIPLYKIRYKELTLPISIIYNTIGNKPDIFPGPVGLGWALQAGGMITRIIKGSPVSRGIGLLGDDVRDLTNWDDVYNHFGFEIQTYNVTFENKVNPDEFCYNINGNTGSFYVNHKDTFQVQSDQGDFFHVILHKRGSIKYSFPKPPQITGLTQLQQNELYGNPYIFNSPDFVWKDSVEVDSYINGFTMIDSNGIKYLFGNTDYVKNNDNAIEFSRLGHSVYVLEYRPFVQPTTWYLTSIESPNSYKITLRYGREAYISKFHFTDRVLFKMRGASNANSTPDAQWDNAYRTVYINGSVLEEIEFPGGKVIFDTSTATEQLDFDENPSGSTPESKINDYHDINYMNRFYYYPDISFANTAKIVVPNSSESNSEIVRNRFFPKKVDKISVFDTQNNLIRAIDFQYTNSRSTRLKLNNFTISGTNSGASSLKYSFEYDPYNLPHYLSKKTDHYGFYNNKLLYEGIQYTLLISHILNNNNYYDEKKKPDFTYAKAEILTKIVYPTGGYSVLEYEPHKFGQVYETWPFGTRAATEQDGTRNDAGGLRIKSVNNYDNNDNLIKSTEYVYTTQSGSSSGVLAYIPEYVTYYYAMENVISTGNVSGQGMNGFYVGNGTQVENRFDYFLRYSSNPIHPMGNTRGSHVTYSEVKVIEGDDAGVNGYTIYKYKNYDNGYADQQLKGYVCKKLQYRYNPTQGIEYWKNEEGISMKHERGQLILEEVFDKTGNKVKRVNYTYNYNPDESVRFLKNVFNDITFTGTRNMMIVSGVHYTYHPWLKQKREVLYLGSDSLVTRVTNTYNDKYRLLKTTEITDSRGDVLINENFYPFDKLSENIYQTMTDKYMVAYPTGAISIKNDEKIAESKTEYNTGLGIENSSLILPHKEYFGIGGATPELISIVNEYDKIGNPLSITDDKSGDKVCYLWSYEGSYPVAKIVGLNYNEVEGVLTEQTIKDLWDSTNPDSQIKTIRTSLESTGAMVTTYTYLPLVGMVTETDFRGVTTYYEYDDMGRLIEIRAGKKDSPTGDETQQKIEQYEYHYNE